MAETGWISVEDRLPVDDDYVLVVSNGYTAGGIYYDALQKIWVDDDSVYPMEYNVTHWMPLPDPPEDK